MTDKVEIKLLFIVTNSKFYPFGIVNGVTYISKIMFDRDISYNFTSEKYNLNSTDQGIWDSYISNLPYLFSSTTIQQEQLKILNIILTYMKPKILETSTVTIDPDGYKVRYIVLKSTLNKSPNDKLLSVDEDDNINILLFQEDRESNMKQLTASPDWDLEYKIINYGFFTPTYRAVEGNILLSVDDLLHIKPDFYNDFVDKRFENEQRWHKTIRYYTEREFTNMNIIKRNTDGDLVRQILNYDIKVVSTGMSFLDSKIYSKMKWDELQHLVDTSSIVRNLVNTNHFLIDWMTHNGYPLNILKDQFTYNKNMTNWDFMNIIHDYVDHSYLIRDKLGRLTVNYYTSSGLYLKKLFNLFHYLVDICCDNCYSNSDNNVNKIHRETGFNIHDIRDILVDETYFISNRQETYTKLNERGINSPAKRIEMTFQIFNEDSDKIEQCKLYLITFLFNNLKYISVVDIDMNFRDIIDKCVDMDYMNIFIYFTKQFPDITLSYRDELIQKIKTTNYNTRLEKLYSMHISGQNRDRYVEYLLSL